MKWISIALILQCLCVAALTWGDEPPVSETEWVDVSHSLGFPLGGLGTGYSAFGRYGFVKVNFKGRPTDVLGAGHWEYLQEPPVKASYGFVLIDRDRQYALQTTAAAWMPGAELFESVKTSACLPKGRAVFTRPGLDLSVTVSAYTPLLPHDLAASTVPVQIFEVTVANASAEPRSVSLKLANAEEGQPSGDRVVFASKAGQLAFAADQGAASLKGVTVSLQVPAGQEAKARFYIAWYYPEAEWSKRYYTLAFSDVNAVLNTAAQKCGEWSSRIDAWHASLQVPAFLKRLWFSSLSSVMTSTIMTSDPYFYEVETPHGHVNTMDVCVYSNWVYLINWPELERMDMSQYFKAIPTEGDKAGFVWHSLWKDAAHYVEEPAFLARLTRDHLWFNDPAWTRTGYPQAVRAAQRVYGEDAYQGLINSKHGNQSYDAWKMPGVSAYVNSAWIYGLHGLELMGRHLGEKPVRIGGIKLSDLRARAVKSFDRLLWNPKTKSWNCFFRTPDASPGSTADTVFSDQLFGKWVLAVDPSSDQVLSKKRTSTALHTIYKHNLMEDPAQGFRGWINGMLPHGKPDARVGYHARTCWLGPQINLASLLALDGDEAASLDVIRSVESSLHNDLLAVGEWNRSGDEQGRVVVLAQEPEKDTPRFAPYPRYKSCWEYLPRLLGLRLDPKKLHLRPFKTVDFSLDRTELAGMILTVKVQSGWKRVRVNGKPVKGPVALPRTAKEASVEFLR